MPCALRSVFRYNWIDSLKATANAAVSDAQLDAAEHRFPHQPPKTKEAYVVVVVFVGLLLL